MSKDFLPQKDMGADPAGFQGASLPCPTPGCPYTTQDQCAQIGCPQRGKRTSPHNCHPVRPPLSDRAPDGAVTYRAAPSFSKLRVLDLFSGIGGFSLGLERTGGFETVAFCEIEEFPRRVLAKHWPEVPQYEDVTKLTGDILARDGIAVDVITGGFPCQDISVLGRRAGMEGERSGLWSEIIRLIRDVRPQFVLLENTASLCVRGLDRVCADLATSGYDAEWDGIPAAAIGAPHLRARERVLAYPASFGQRMQNQTVFAGRNPIEPSNWWATEPGVDRVADGVPNHVDRHHCLGNAVVPQIPELIGNAILQAEGIQTARVIADLPVELTPGLRGRGAFQGAEI